MSDVVALKDVAEFDPRAPTNALRERNPAVAFMPMADVLAEKSVATAKQERQAIDVMTGYSYFRNNDVLVAKITPCFENGKTALAEIEQEHGFGTTEFHVLRTDSKKLFAKYLAHFLRQPWVIAEGERKMTGSAGQRRVPRHFFQSLKIPLPSLEEQRKIAAILDKAEALRGKRREALTKLDTLTQSIFLDRFGEHVANSNSFKSVRLTEVTTRITDGTHLTPEFVDAGVPFIFVKNIKNGEIDFRTEKFITEAEHQILYKRCPVEPGDVLYTTVGATYGQAAPVGAFTKFAFQRHIAHLKPDPKKVLPEFLSIVMQLPLTKNQADRWARGAAQPTINLKELREFEIPLPSLSSQQAFVHRASLVERLKPSLRSSLVKIDVLFASLRDRAFREKL